MLQPFPSLHHPEDQHISLTAMNSPGWNKAPSRRTQKLTWEHPGPEAPSTSKGGNQGSSQSQDHKSSQSSGPGAGPKIHQPKSAAEKENPEVKKHNEELEQRYERTANQLSEKDNKVDKHFWSGKNFPRQESLHVTHILGTGDVGRPSEDKK